MRAMSRWAGRCHEVGSAFRGFMMSFITSAATSSDVLRTVILHNYRRELASDHHHSRKQTYLGLSIGLQSHQAAHLAVS